MRDEVRVLVCGGRTYRNQGLVNETLNKMQKDFGIDLIIQGGATGADHLSKTWAKENGIPCAEMEANWHYYGPAAGPRRNLWMINLLRPNLVVAFEGGKGTADMIMKAHKAGVAVMQIEDR
ncbi:MAG: DUF2493 domain-containing protein [Reinekea sp.]|nr:DUF2493 domain-containing protein [Reinekea sp.]